MRAVLPQSIVVPRIVALLLATAMLAVSVFVTLARDAPGVSPTPAHAPRLPATVSLVAPTTGGANDSSPLFGPQP